MAEEIKQTPETTPQPDPEKTETPEPVKEPEKKPEVSDRTGEQFEKLTQHNQQLKEKAERAEQAQAALQQEIEKKNRILQDFLGVQRKDPEQTEEGVEQFLQVDPITGEKVVNLEKLETWRKNVSEAKKTAEQTREEFQKYIKGQEEQDQQRQRAETIAAYPQLNPEAKNFDKELSGMTRALLIDSWGAPQDYGGKKLTFKEAADLASTRLGRAKPEVTPKTPKEEITQEPASVSSTTVEASRSETMEEQRLADLTRKGGVDGMWAVAARLAKIDHTGTPKSTA